MKALILSSGQWKAARGALQFLALHSASLETATIPTASELGGVGWGVGHRNAAGGSRERAVLRLNCGNVDAVFFCLINPFLQLTLLHVILR